MQYGRIASAILFLEDIKGRSEIGFSLENFRKRLTTFLVSEGVNAETSCPSDAIALMDIRTDQLEVLAPYIDSLQSQLSDDDFIRIDNPLIGIQLSVQPALLRRTENVLFPLSSSFISMVHTWYGGLL